MAELLVKDTSLAAIADAIRAKAETTKAFLFPNGFIEAIANLGGLPRGISAMSAGEYIPSSDIGTPIGITHGLGVKPNFAVVILKNKITSTPSGLFLGVYLEKAVGSNARNYYEYSYGQYGTESSQGVAYFTEEEFRANTTGYPMKAGATYCWFAAVIDGVDEM